MHWLHLFDFSPLWVLRCWLEELGSEQAKSHWTFLQGVFNPFPCITVWVAFVLRFFTASFQTSPLSKLKWDVIKVSLVAFVWSYSLCVFIYAFSKCLPEWMHIHTGCICLNFLHCDLSSGSTKQLPKRMECYVGRMCFAFIHCVF